MSSVRTFHLLNLYLMIIMVVIYFVSDYNGFYLKYLIYYTLYSNNNTIILSFAPFIRTPDSCRYLFIYISLHTEILSKHLHNNVQHNYKAKLFKCLVIYVY